MWIEGVPLEELSSPPHVLSCGTPKGCVGVRTNPPPHAIVLRELWIRSKTDLLPQYPLDRSDQKKSSFTVCV
jgi:hypothetical protein